MIDLLQHAQPLGTKDGKEWRELPAGSWLAKTAETPKDQRPAPV